MKTIRKLLITVLAIIFLLPATGVSVRAAENKCPFEIEAESDAEAVYEKNRLFIYGGTVLVGMAKGVKETNSIIEIRGDSTLILEGISIEAKRGAAIKVWPGVYCQIVLRKENTVKGAPGFAGLESRMVVGDEKVPHVSSNLRIGGEGALTAIGGEGGAGIGSGKGHGSCGKIVIEGGTVTAIGGAGADGIGRGIENETDPVEAPRILDTVTALTAQADGNGTAILSRALGRRSGSVEAEAAAALLCGTFADSEDGKLAGLQKVSVTDTKTKEAVVIDMPDGYRDFAVKVKPGTEYTISQGGHLFTVSGEEQFTEEVKDGDGVQTAFAGSDSAESCLKYLVPVQDAGSADIKVSGSWDDGNDKDGTRPESVTVALYANGKDTGLQIVLREENDWSGTFEDVALYKGSQRQAYSIVEEKLEGYTGSISGSDEEGYAIRNHHDPLPEGRSAQEEIVNLPGGKARRETVVSTVITSKVSRSMPVRTSTTIRKTMSAKTSDSSGTMTWGGLLITAMAALYVWIHFEQKKD